jgi:ferredoxin-NADP reductase
MAGFLAALQMNREKIWSECDDSKYDDHRIVSLLERKKIDNQTLALSFEKPTGFQHKKGQYSILNLLNPKVTELDLPYRWLPVDSSAKEDTLRFHVELDDSSFSKSCELIDIGDQAMIFGPMS